MSKPTAYLCLFNYIFKIFLIQENKVEPDVKDQQFLAFAVFIFIRFHAQVDIKDFSI